VLYSPLTEESLIDAKDKRVLRLSIGSVVLYLREIRPEDRDRRCENRGVGVAIAAGD
jgi:hypothetical protein